jgi:hypothetical protein
MDGNGQVRWGWLKFMFIYTVIGAGGFGLGMIFTPPPAASNIRVPRHRSGGFRA